MITPASLLASLKPGHPGRAAIMATCADTAEGKPVTRRGKYNAVPTVVNNIRFASKREADAYSRIVLMEKSGDVLWFLRQVPFRFASGIAYWCDFLLVMRDGGVRVVDAKGCKTKTFVLKMKLMKQEYPGAVVELW
jgi:hypothetical protein